MPLPPCQQLPLIWLLPATLIRRCQRLRALRAIIIISAIGCSEELLFFADADVFMLPPYAMPRHDAAADAIFALRHCRHYFRFATPHHFATFTLADAAAVLMPIRRCCRLRIFCRH